MTGRSCEAVAPPCGATVGVRTREPLNLGVPVARDGFAGPTARRDEATRLRNLGLSFKEIGERVGVSARHARYLADPVYAEQSRRASREAKRRRTGVCARCGGETRYAGKSSAVADVCASCAPDAYRIWDETAVIASIRRWAAKHGAPPTAGDWLVPTPENTGYPYVSGIQALFGSWSLAIEAAGFQPRRQGERTTEGQARLVAALTKYTADVLLELIRECESLDGVASSTFLIPNPILVACRREFGSWKQACLAAGVSPRGHAHRDRSCRCGFGPTTAKGVLAHQSACVFKTTTEGGRKTCPGRAPALKETE